MFRLADFVFSCFHDIFRFINLTEIRARILISCSTCCKAEMQLHVTAVLNCYRYHPWYENTNYSTMIVHIRLHRGAERKQKQYLTVRLLPESKCGDLMCLKKLEVKHVENLLNDVLLPSIQKLIGSK